MEAKRSLIDIDSDYRQIVREIEAVGGELTPESEKAFDELALALCQKVDAYFVVTQRLEQECAYWKAQSDHCRQAERVFINAALKLKERMKYVLGAHPDKSLQGDISRFFLVKGRDTLILDEETVPREYKTAKIELVVDRDKVEADLKMGIKVPGAALKTENYSLRQGRPK